MIQRKYVVLIILCVIALPFANAGWAMVSWFAVYPIQYCLVGKPSHQKARAAADSAMAKWGPWECAADSFILDFDGSEQGAPNWVFRYRDTRTGEKSIRIYVSIPECKVHHTGIGLDQEPLHGSLPR
jgi:hypothetical protein